MYERKVLHTKTQTTIRTRLLQWHEQIGNGFLSHGWLMPILFASALQGGRAAFHILFYSYILWAVLALRTTLRFDCPRCRAVLLALALLLCARLPGNLMAQDPARAFTQWAISACYLSVMPITLMVLERDQRKLSSLLTALGWGAWLMMIGVAFNLIGLLVEHGLDFEPRINVRAVEFGFCLPFAVLLWRQRIGFERHRISGAVLLVLMLLFVLYADERSAVYGFLIALLCLLKLIGRFPLWQMAVVFTLFGVSALLATHNAEAFINFFTTLSFDSLDQFSSGRLGLWQRAISNPPLQPWFGVGMGNVQYANEVMQIGLAKVRHLHNVWFDAWYEGGWLGVLTLVAFLSYAFFYIWRNRLEANRETVAFVLIAAVAVMVQSQLSISYLSREFNIYIGICLAVLIHSSGRRKNV